MDGSWLLTITETYLTPNLRARVLLCASRRDRGSRGGNAARGRWRRGGGGNKVEFIEFKSIKSLFYLIIGLPRAMPWHGMAVSYACMCVSLGPRMERGFQLREQNRRSETAKRTCRVCTMCMYLCMYVSRFFFFLLLGLSDRDDRLTGVGAAGCLTPQTAETFREQPPFKCPYIFLSCTIQSLILSPGIR